MSPPIPPVPSPSLAAATRLNLGNASCPPPRSRLLETLSSFSDLASEVGADLTIVAVDGMSRFDGYDLVGEVEDLCRSLPVPGGKGGGDRASCR